MSANTQVAQREAQAVQGKGEEPALIPAVDIYEDHHGITVQADMPGVAKERLNIQADRNSLLIEGEAAIDMPAGTEALYVDVPVTRFRRSFVRARAGTRSNRGQSEGRSADGPHPQARGVSPAQDRSADELSRVA